MHEHPFPFIVALIGGAYCASKPGFLTFQAVRPNPTFEDRLESFLVGTAICLILAFVILMVFSPAD